MFVSPPNTFQNPNDLVDHWLPHLKEAELKVLLVVLRKTFGWRKYRDRISLSQLAHITGMKKDTVINAGRTLQEKGLITREVIGPNGRQETYYELVITEDSNNSYPSNERTPPSPPNGPPPVQSADPQNTTQQNPFSYVKDNVCPEPEKPKPKNGPQKTMFHKQKDKGQCFMSKEKDITKKYKLTPEQIEVYQQLKSWNLDTDDNTLCWWAKNYTLSRIIEVYEAAKKKKPRSLSAYMQKLFKIQAHVANAYAKINQEFARDFKESNKWNDLKIGDMYVTFHLGNDMQDISLNLDPYQFIEALMRKHENITSMRSHDEF